MVRIPTHALFALLGLIAACVAAGPAHGQKAPTPTQTDFLTKDLDEDVMDRFIDAYERAEWPRWLTVVGMDARAFGGDADHRRMVGRDTPLLFFDPTGLTDSFRARLNSILLDNPDLDLLDLEGLEDADRRRAEGINSDGAKEVVEMMAERVGADIVLYVEVRAIPDDLRNKDEPLFKVFYRLQDRRTDRLISENTFPWNGRSDPKYLKFLAVQTLTRALEDFNQRAGRRPSHVPVEIFVQAIGDAQGIEIKRAIDRFDGVRGRVTMEEMRRGGESLTVYRFRYGGDFDELLYDLNQFARAELDLEFRTQDKRLNSAVLLAQAAEDQTPDWLVYTSDRAPGHADALRRLRAVYDRKGAPVVGVLINPEDASVDFNVRSLSQELGARFRDAGLQVEMIRGETGWDVRDLGFDLVVLGEFDKAAADGASYRFDVYDVRNDRFIDSQGWPDRAALRSRRHPIDPADLDAVSRYIAGTLLASMAVDFADASVLDVVLHLVDDARHASELALAIAEAVPQVERVSNLRFVDGCARFSLRYHGEFLSVFADLQGVLDRFSLSLASSTVDRTVVELVVRQPGRPSGEAALPDDHRCDKRRLLPPSPRARIPSEATPVDDEKPRAEPPQPNAPDSGANPGSPSEPGSESPRSRRGREAARERPNERVVATSGAIDAVQDYYDQMSKSDPSLHVASASPPRDRAAGTMRFDGILVMRKPTAPRPAGVQGLSFENLKRSVIGEIEVIKGQRGGADVLNSPEFRRELQKVRDDPTVDYAGPNYVYDLSSLPPTRLARAQWAFGNAHNPSNTIQWVEAADTISNIQPSLVGVVDQGIHVEDPRLRDMLWVNPKEIPGNGKDDDGNGYIDDVHGFNFVNSSATLDWGRDVSNHGTFCSSQIGARLVGASNDIISVAPRARVLTAVAADASGRLTEKDVFDGIDYAVAHGAKVINLSLGGYRRSHEELRQQAQTERFAYLRDQGVILVVAAGNGRRVLDKAGRVDDFVPDDLDVVPYWPAGVPSDNIITVASIDPDGMLGRGWLAKHERWDQYSNFGARTVDLAAPGSRMLGVNAYGTSSMWDGTSMAAPMVTATVALIQGQHPDWDYQTVIRAVIESVRPFEALDDKVRSGGALDVQAALNWTP